MTFKKLNENKDSILLAEIGALIHDLGKLSREFVESKSEECSQDNKSLNCNFEHEKITKEKFKGFLPELLRGFLENENLKIIDAFKNSKLKNYRIGDFQSLEKFSQFISKHGDYECKVVPIYPLAKPGCDAVDSGLDKGAPVKKQRLNETYISTAFGYDKERINPSHLTEERNQFCAVLERELKKIERALDGKENFDEIYEARNTIIGTAEKHFSKALGETRRAANDVTLWDHSYSVASLYKSALAGIILEHEDENEELPHPSSLKWKILSVKVNGLDFWMKSEKIGDILARKKLIKKCFSDLKKLLEFEVPFGNEVYRDENQIAFLVYGDFSEYLEIGSDLDDIDERRELEGKTIKEAIKHIFAERTEGELIPQVQLTEEKSRGAATIGEVLKKIPQFNKVDGKRISSHWDEIQKEREEDEDLDKCHVCELRAIGFPKNGNPAKAKDRNICTVCLGRRKNRSGIWIEDLKEDKETTIWMDELADTNNRVAFIVGKFDLTNWINGRYLNSTLVKTISDLHNQNDGQKDLAGINTYFDLLDAAKQSFAEDIIRINGYEIERTKFLKAIGGDSYHGESTEDYFKALVIDREKEFLEEELGSVESWNVETKARLLISFLFRKNPSFARIRRVWETTKEFWRGCEREIKDSCLSKRQRYEIRFKDDVNDFTPSHTYYVKISGKFVPTVANSKDKMLIVDRKDNIPRKLLENKDIAVEVFESNKKDKVTDRRCVLKDVHLHSKYIPYLNILKEPLSFISVVPANKAFKIVNDVIKARYEKEFSKVRNRLPFYLNLIFMNKKMPVYTALDSAKRFLEFKEGKGSWEVLSLCDREREGEEFKKRTFTLKREAEIFQTEVDLKLGNGEKDYYHPYFLLKRGNCPDQRDTYFETYKEEKLVHAQNIVTGDVVQYCPSHFDFQFLDSNARRFDIVHGNEKRPHAIFKNGPRPYYLEDLGIITEVWEILNKKNIDNTQLNNFESLLIAKIEEWELNDLEKLKENTEFKELTKSSIKNILRVKDEESGEFRILYNSVLSGMFFDVKELYRSILKQKLGGEENK